GGRMCPECGGSGRRARQARQQGGFFSISSPCGTCGGSGVLPGVPCGACGGSGRSGRERALQVKIPPGVSTGTVLRLAGQGEAGVRGGPPGDLLLEIELEPHPEFERDGLDIRSSVKVPLKTALLGGEVIVPTLRGSVSVKVPKGTSSDAWLRVRGQGIEARGGKGDHLVRVVVTVPRSLSPEAERAVREHF
ncbi:MAG: DnaJ C-terminal domain-containing protein, partial [Planctomycetota bacterium]